MTDATPVLFLTKKLAEANREIERLRAALKPFAEIPLWRDTYPDGPEIFPGASSHLLGTFTPQQIRAARAALEQGETK